jgi:hypothetical protein
MLSDCGGLRFLPVDTVSHPSRLQSSPNHQIRFIYFYVPSYVILLLNFIIRPPKIKTLRQMQLQSRIEDKMIRCEMWWVWTRFSSGGVQTGWEEMDFLSVLCSTVRLRGSHLAQAFEYPRSRKMWQTVPLLIKRLSTNSSDRTACARQIMEVSFFCFGSRHSFHPATNGGTVDRSTSINIAKTSGSCFSVTLSPQQGSLSEHVVDTAHHWPTPLWGATAVVLSVRNIYKYST